ncbi:phosphoenolpyruvate-utilizing N-terminal domain-containing protein [Trabulsiella odontotermitis]|uniref:phosphoenolpyruvate-utilizing N-terminal domain-containing protein n=1 Tax=Trabulsiella odontotermitis TaxID=379893 RepID=UPI003ACEECA1
MQIVAGTIASPGIVLGHIGIWHPAIWNIDPQRIVDSAQELQRFEQACDVALSQLQALEDSVRDDTGEETAQLFSAHQLMLQDDDFQQEIRDAISREHASAAWAVKQTGELFAAQMAAMEDTYFQARAVDIRDVAGRLITLLCGHPRAAQPAYASNTILLAEEITPSETVQLDRQRIVAIVTRQGSSISHSAILARAMGIPAIMGLNIPALPDEWEGLEALVDSATGHLYLSPDSETRQRYHDK